MAGAVEKIESFWSMPLSELSERLDTNLAGLTDVEAKRRARVYGPNHLRKSKRRDSLTLLMAQFKSPLILILLVAAGPSFFFNESVDASIIIAIVLLRSLCCAPGNHSTKAKLAGRYSSRWFLY